jgi:putrescine transport system permease protein
VIALPFLWMLRVLRRALPDRAEDLLRRGDDRDAALHDVVTRTETGIAITLNLENYLYMVRDSLYVAAYLGSLKIAVISTLCLPADRLPDGLRHRAARRRRCATWRCCWSSCRPGRLS